MKVNVHRQKADSLAWGRVAYRDLPGDFCDTAAPDTAATADAVYCLTADTRRRVLHSHSRRSLG